jgi:hypothetical protein
MPKVEHTRRQRAAELEAMIKNGPAFSDPTMFGGAPLTVEEVTAQYKRWAETWVLPEVTALVPELKPVTREQVK